MSVTAAADSTIPAERRFIGVAVPPLDTIFTYELGLPDDPVGAESPTDAVGRLVDVPFGRRVSHGYIVEAPSDPSIAAAKTRVVPYGNLGQRAFLPEQLDFFRWIAEYLGVPLSTVLETAIPASTPPRTTLEAEIVPGFVPPPDFPAKSRKLLDAITELGGRAPMKRLAALHRGARKLISELEAVGAARLTKTEERTPFFTGEIAAWAKRDVTLGAEQLRAYETVRETLLARTFGSYLLHGVTGSGKTEVYIELIRAAHAEGMSALVLVPEIALTPQLLDRFRARLPENLLALHSGLAKRERWDSWRSVLEGAASVVIGTRSAVFAPVPRLGLIIVDEEHDSSFKQSDGLRYHARDLALVRAQRIGCPVILGSATPSLESYLNAGRKKYGYLALTARPENSTTPKLEVVDMRKYRERELAAPNVSPELFEGLKETIESGRQAMVLYNRRGFASFLQCERCATALRCVNCSVTLTYHRDQHSLLCHYCNLSISPPQFCTSCTVSDEHPEPAKLVHRGAGTERVLAELEMLFPGISIERMDRDAIDSFAEYESLLARMRSGDIRILVGTQMLAKGHDLPNVTLVGIVDGDVGLHLPDFRAAERVFHTLTQAAGRAGRGDYAGRVILQTRVPDHPAVRWTLAGNFRGFAKQELESRQTLDYPPFGRLVRVIVSSEAKEKPPRCAFELVTRLRALAQSASLPVQVIGPAPSPIARVKARWRWHFLMKSKSYTALAALLPALRAAQKQAKDVRIAIDLEPQDMM